MEKFCFVFESYQCAEENGLCAPESISRWADIVDMNQYRSCHEAFGIYLFILFLAFMYSLRIIYKTQSTSQPNIERVKIVTPGVGEYTWEQVPVPTVENIETDMGDEIVE